MGLIIAAAAVLLPIFVIARDLRRKPMRNPFMLSLGSFGCAFGALCMMLFNVDKRFAVGDIGGVEDTIGALIFLAVSLSVITVLLNAWALGLSYARDREEKTDKTD